MRVVTLVALGPSELRLNGALAQRAILLFQDRTHLSLDKDCPDSHPIVPRKIGKAVAIAQVGGLRLA